MLGRTIRALESPARARPAYLVAAATGIVIYLAVFGIGHPLGTSSYWDLPLTDHRAYLLGYRYFLAEPWHWPVFSVNTMNVPFAKSIAFSDAIPVWAFANKALATVVPPWGRFTEHAYLGLWYLMLYALQPVVAVANVRALGQRSWAATIATALIFVAAPAWVNRYVHASMSAHFITLWAIYLYLTARSAGATPRRRAHQLAQLAVATLVNPYHAMMSFGLFVAALLARRDRKAVLVWGAAGLALMAVLAWVAGYFAKEAALQMFGFDVASTNVLSFVMPYDSTLFGNALYADPTGYQYEGLAYAGLGVVVLLALYLPRARRLGAVIARHRWLFAVALGAWVLALSTHIWIGGWQLVAYTLPSKLAWIADQFRSPGRFVWVPMYVAMLFLVKEGLARFSRGRAVLLVPALAVLQVVDTAGGWAVIRSNTRAPFAARIDTAGWRALIGPHDQVRVFPSYDCVLDGTPDMDYVSLDLEYIASERALPINGVYTARPTRNCAYDEQLLARTTPAAGTLYVLLRRDQDTAYRFLSQGAACGEFGFGRACSRDHAAIDAAIRSGLLTPVPPPPAAPALAFGATLAVTPTTPAAMFAYGWTWPDGDGRFTDGPLGRLVLHVTDAPAGPASLSLTVSSPVCGGRHRNYVDVALDGVPLGGFALPDDQPRTVTLAVPPGLLGHATSYLDIIPRDHRVLKMVGCNHDYRALGVLVRSLAFR